MSFIDWQQLVKSAGGDISIVDQTWLLSQYQAGLSPVVVANQIRQGLAPSPAPVVQMSYPVQRGIFSSGPYFCAHLMLWHGWLIISSAIGLLLLSFANVAISTAASRKPNDPFGAMGVVLSISMLTFVVPALLGLAAMGALFVVSGCYVRKNIHQFEN